MCLEAAIPTPPDEGYRVEFRFRVRVRVRVGVRDLGLGFGTWC